MNCERDYDEDDASRLANKGTPTKVGRETRERAKNRATYFNNCGVGVLCENLSVCVPDVENRNSQKCGQRTTVAALDADARVASVLESAEIGVQRECCGNVCLDFLEHGTQTACSDIQCTTSSDEHFSCINVCGSLVLESLDGNKIYCDVCMNGLGLDSCEFWTCNVCQFVCCGGCVERFSQLKEDEEKDDEDNDPPTCEEELDCVENDFDNNAGLEPTVCMGKQLIRMLILNPRTRMLLNRSWKRNVCTHPRVVEMFWIWMAWII